MFVLRISNRLRLCGENEIYDMDFVANFTDSTTAKKICKLVNMFQTYERICSGTAFIETRCRLSCAKLLTAYRSNICIFHNDLSRSCGSCIYHFISSQVKV